MRRGKYTQAGRAAGADAQTCGRDWSFQSAHGRAGLMGRMHTYTFPRAAVTKYHKLGGLKQQYLSSLSSGGQKFKNQGVRRTKLALNPIKEKPSLSPPASDGGRQSLASWCAAGSL